MVRAREIRQPKTAAALKAISELMQFYNMVVVLNLIGVRLSTDIYESSTESRATI